MDPRRLTPPSDRPNVAFDSLVARAIDRPPKPRSLILRIRNVPMDPSPAEATKNTPVTKDATQSAPKQMSTDESPYKKRGRLASGKKPTRGRGWRPT